MMSQRWRLAYGAAITVGAIAIVWALNVRDAKTEPTFPATQPRQLVVAIESSAAYHAEAIRESMASVNSVAGCTRLREGAAADITIVGTTAEPCGDTRIKHAEASYYECRNGSRWIQLRNVVEHARAVVVLEHELGHALGHLDHDPRDGMMSESAEPPLWSDKDKAELRRGCP